jgi:hypothetical protein
VDINRATAAEFVEKVCMTEERYKYPKDMLVGGGLREPYAANVWRHHQPQFTTRP